MISTLLSAVHMNRSVREGVLRLQLQTVDMSPNLSPNSHPTSAVLWLSLRSHLINALSIIIEFSARLLHSARQRQSPLQKDILTCTIKYSKMLWEISAFEVEGMSPTFGEVLAQYCDTEKLIKQAFHMSFSVFCWEMNWIDSNMTRISIDDLRCGNLHCAVSIMALPTLNNHFSLLSGAFLQVVEGMVYTILDSYQNPSIMDTVFGNQKQLYFINISNSSNVCGTKQLTSLNSMRLVHNVLCDRYYSDKQAIVKETLTTMELYMLSCLLLVGCKFYVHQTDYNKMHKAFFVAFKQASVSKLLLQYFRNVLKCSKSADRELVGKYSDCVDHLLNELYDAKHHQEVDIAFTANNKVYTNLLKLLTHINAKQVIDSAPPELQSSKEDLEVEVVYIRRTVSAALSSGQWELGSAIVKLLIEKLTPEPSQSNIIRNSSRSRLDISDSLSNSSDFNNSGSPTSFIGANSLDSLHSPYRPLSFRNSFDHSAPMQHESKAITSPKRPETIRAELCRSLDLLSDKLRSDNVLRLVPTYFALRIVSNSPFGLSSR